MKNLMLAAAAMVIATSAMAYGVSGGHASAGHVSVSAHSAPSVHTAVVEAHTAPVAHEAPVAKAPIAKTPVIVPVGHVSAAKPVSGASAVKGK
jgi:hypothetical protein